MRTERGLAPDYPAVAAGTFLAPIRQRFPELADLDDRAIAAIEAAATAPSERAKEDRVRGLLEARGIAGADRTAREIIDFVLP